ncbi:MAG: NAD+ synthase [Phycisphaerales bacterium]|nr:MAG: NAD+ synthase [Phycisphaerales bacterium]
MRVALGQFNAVVGDLAGNAQKMREFYAEAVRADVDLLAFPELSLGGYPPEDLLLKRHFLDDCSRTLDRMAADCPEKTILVGFAESDRRHTCNSAAVLQAGRVSSIYRKALLPNYGVFDEKRYFTPGVSPLVITVDGLRVAITICFDIWNVDWLGKFLEKSGPIHLIMNISASPFHTGKLTLREETISKCAREFSCAVAYCNLVGGQDELIFDGRSIFADSTGHVVARAKAFGEDLIIADVAVAADGTVQVRPLPRSEGRPTAQPDSEQPAGLLDEIYQALVLGTRDYARKNGFKKVLLGLSGGIDSSVTAGIAVEALGAENVIGVTMPSKFNSPETISDAEKLAKNLDIEFHTIPIAPILGLFHEALGTVEDWDDTGLAFENLQARIRGCILMSLSNQFGSLVLTTGNKSETAVGYATLYGDTAGGFAVIKDVLKTTVYELAEYINRRAGRPVIPQDVITRPPSAELRPDQKDSDSLPDYDLLDRILKGYVEEDKSVTQLTAEGLARDVVDKVVRMVDRNEYKRRLSPPGIRITPKAFGKDRRLPITNRYSHSNYAV